MLAVLAAFGFAGCGGGDGSEPSGGAAATTPASTATPELAQFEGRVEVASRARPGDFPAAGGRTLQQIADLVNPGTQVGLATSVYTPGRNRFAFGVIGADGRLLFAPTAVYLAENGSARARGPFVATLDPLVVEPRFRSAGSAAEDGNLAAIYAAQVTLPKVRTYELLIVSRVGGRLLGAPTIIPVTAKSPVPEVGQPAPVVATDTVASAGGDLDAIETRDPTDGLHDVSLADVVGRRPVALIFSTPALCKSRVCGPVLDVAVQLADTYGGRIAFIHQEVFVDNRPDQGFRPPLRAFGLPTEPWLFTIDSRGRVAARLEGSFGVAEFREAVEAALGETG